MTVRRKKTNKTPWLSGWRRQWLMLGLKISLAIALGLVIYLIYLDSKITTLFSGQKWQMPAQLYGRALTLHQGKYLPQSALLRELKVLQYREDARLDGPGQYAIGEQSIRIYRRAFDFPAKAEPARLITVRFAEPFIASVHEGAQQQAIAQISLEPQLIQHLVASEQEDRELLQLSQVPKPILQSLLLVEDRDFYQHHGVSLWSIMRAAWTNAVAGRTVQGGSTLTQQLAKNMYTNQQRTLWRKINEALIALVLDYRYSKDEILEAYLNEIFTGQFKDNPVHGMALGSRFYFGKPLAELRPHEYALLIGVIKGPTYFDPRRFPQRAQQRRDLILHMMSEHGVLSASQVEAAVQQPLDVIPLGDHLKGRYPAYLAKVRQELKQLLPSPEQHSSGIRIFTHLDPVAQTAAEQALVQRLQTIKAPVEGAVVVTDLTQGGIKALVGGKETSFAGYNRALDARRPIGSIIKPLIYLGALQNPQQFSLGTVLQDTPLTLRSGGRQWSPQNYDKRTRGAVPLVQALSESLNIPTVRLGLQVGLPRLEQTLHQLGFTRDIKLQPSSLLGAVEMSPLEVAQLYQVLGNRGQHRALAAIYAISDVTGKTLYLRAKDAKQVVDISAVYLLDYAMQQATRSGTAQALAQKFPRQRFAGKTGTSSDYRDSWFSGYDHDTGVTVWLGRDDNQQIGLTGGSGALPVFMQYFATTGSNSLFRAAPQNVSKYLFSKQTGRIVADHCTNVLFLPAISGQLQGSDNCD
jgi:penicillin-binding protein 1B